jgi:hypothetical protein
MAQFLAHPAEHRARLRWHKVSGQRRARAILRKIPATFWIASCLAGWRHQPGRPAISREVCDLIRRMSRENPLWGAPHVQGELLKLGIEIGETTVAKYRVRHRKPPSQSWRTFLNNHVHALVSVDFFTVPTIRFQALYVFLVLAHERRRIVHWRSPKSGDCTIGTNGAPPAYR